MVSWLNRRMLVTDARYLHPKGINAFEDPGDQPDAAKAEAEHAAAVTAFREAGIEVTHIASPDDCQDGVFTANWGLTWNGRVLLSRLPNLRQAEEPYAEAALQLQSFATRRSSVLFSGQGDAMIIGGDRVLIGNGYRTDPKVADEIRDWLGLEPVIVRAKPKRRWWGGAVRNKVTGLWDSYFYDLDIAVAVIRPDLLAVCFDGLTAEGKQAIRSLTEVTIIPVDEHEARVGLGCNLVSTGETVIMSQDAPKLAATLEGHHLKVIRCSNRELRKSGGGFRCISLSLYS